MASRTFRARALVLDRTKLGETDLILTLLASDGQQLRAVAKGARKPGGKLASRVQLFSRVDLLLAHGRSLDVVCEADLASSPAGVAGDLDRVSAASVVCEVARLASYQDAPDPFLFGVADRALWAVGEAQGPSGSSELIARLDLVTAAYAFKVLSHQGWRPETDACVACGDPAVSWFSAELGGAVCASCARTVAGAEPVDQAQLAWVRACVGLTFDQLLTAPADPSMAAWLVRCAHGWASTHLEARLKAFEFLLSL